MKALELSFDLILSSPFVRARQTAEIVAAALRRRKKPAFSNALLPSAAPEELLRVLRRRDDLASVLLVGHEPMLSKLISHLICDGCGAPIALKKGGLCKLTLAAPARDERAELNWLLTPRQLRELGYRKA